LLSLARMDTFSVVAASAVPRQHACDVKHVTTRAVVCCLANHPILCQTSRRRHITRGDANSLLLAVVCFGGGYDAASRWSTRRSRKAFRSTVIRCAGATTVNAQGFLDLSQRVKKEDGAAVLESMLSLKEEGQLPLFASYAQNYPSNITVSDVDFRQLGIKSTENLVLESDSLETAVSLAVVFGVAGVIASVVSAPVWATSILLILAVASIAVGSFAPALLNMFKANLPEERNRRVAHEAAHFLVGYLLGAPIRSYSVDEDEGPQVEFDERVGPLAGYTKERDALDAFCVVASSGIAGENMLYEGSRGGAADLRALRNAIERQGGAAFKNTEDKVNFSRWGVYYAASMLKVHRASWDALKEAMSSGRDVSACIQAVERAAPNLPPPPPPPKRDKALPLS